MFSMEVPGSNAGKFSTFFGHLFYPAMTVLFECFDPTIFYSSWFLPCNSIFVTAIFFKLRKA